MARFTKVDEYGPYRDDGNISWPGGGGPRYDVIHPVTGKPCKVPSRGWVYPNIERMQEEIRRGRVVFGKDHTVTPKIRTNLFEQNTEVMRSVQFSYAQTATQQFNKLFDGKRIFENPKNTADIKKLLAYITSDEADGIILDFFSGSATTAHAVMQLNAEDGGHRKFIMVQLPEPCDKRAKPTKQATRISAKSARNASAVPVKKFRKRVWKRLHSQNTNGIRHVIMLNTRKSAIDWDTCRMNTLKRSIRLSIPVSVSSSWTIPT